MRIMDHERGREHWKKVAVERGVKGSTFRTRIMKGMSPKEAALTPVRATTPVIKNPNSAWQVARRHGLGKNAIFDFKRRNPDTTLSYEEIAQLVSKRKAARREREAFNARCRAKNRCPRSVRHWMEKYGLTEEQAIARKPMSRSEIGRQNGKITKRRSEAGDSQRDDRHQTPAGSRTPV